MTERANIHATCVAIGGKGVLILGKSGSGKSDLALRLIEHKTAILVADDRVDMSILGGNLFAQAPDLLKGLLEVRGVGLVNLKYAQDAKISLVVNLVGSLDEIERMPEEKFYTFGSVSLPMLNLYPFEISAVDKVVIKLNGNLEK